MEKCKICEERQKGMGAPETPRRYIIHAIYHFHYLGELKRHHHLAVKDGNMDFDARITPNMDEINI